MGAAPVDAVAGLAAGEILLGASGSRFEQIGDVDLGHRLDLPPAGGAPSVRRQRRPEPVQNVGELVVGSSSANVRRSPKGPPPQQATVLGEQQPILPPGPLDQLVVIGVIAVRGVHAEQPQPPGQRAEVHVQQQPRRAVQRLRPRVSTSTTSVGSGRQAAGTVWPATRSVPTSVSGTPTLCTTWPSEAVGAAATSTTAARHLAKSRKRSCGATSSRTMPSPISPWCVFRTAAAARFMARVGASILVER